MFGLFKKIIKIRQHIIKSPYPWLETICLIDDMEAQRLNDWTTGYYHCRECDTFQGFAFQLPVNGVSVQARNSRTQFWWDHAHGDGRVILSERHIDINE